MEGTPKLPRKSLSLNRLGTKRRNPSPQNKQRLEFQIVTDTSRSPNLERALRSPSVVSLSSDAGCECTPPHKKINLDDSLDYSPRAMDTSCSPSQMLSQSFSIDSPEVGWRWGRRRRTTGSGDDEETKTPDSAYAADSSFTSASPGNMDFRSRTRSDTWRYRQSYDTRRENQRKALEAEIRKAEKQRTDELLKKRCAKLEEQLKWDEKERNVRSEIPAAADGYADYIIQPRTAKAAKQNSFPIINEPPTVTAPNSTINLVNVQKDTVLKCSDSANDYFDDSASDDLLLLATQQVETNIIEATQPSKVPSVKVAPQQGKSLSKVVTQPLFKVEPQATKPPYKASASQLQKTVKASTQQTKPPLQVVNYQPKPLQQSKQLDKVPPPQTKPLVKGDPPQAKAQVKAATPKNVKEKDRSSLYMQFLEDDLSDDIFRNLDEVIKEATQSKKSRNCFQRYNSMPVQTATANDVDVKSTVAAGKNNVFIKQASSEEVPRAGNISKLKRHVSSNALSPSSTSSRGRQLHLKK